LRQMSQELIWRGVQVIEKMERETGFEPATSSLGSWHSTTELLPPAFFSMTSRTNFHSEHRLNTAIVPAIFFSIWFTITDLISTEDWV
jgi:hypothetical protein